MPWGAIGVQFSQFMEEIQYRWVSELWLRSESHSSWIRPTPGWFAEFEPSPVTWVAHSFSAEYLGSSLIQLTHSAFTQGHGFHPELPLVLSTATPTHSFANTTEFTVYQSLGQIYTHIIRLSKWPQFGFNSPHSNVILRNSHSSVSEETVPGFPGDSKIWECIHPLYKKA